MKRTFLIITAIILISTSGNCQWYQKRYGVNDINQLSRDQLNEALRKARTGTIVGFSLSIVGVAGIIGGNALIKFSDTRPGDIGNGLLGISMEAISIISVFTGLTVLLVNTARKGKIKETLKNSEISLGFTNIPTGNLYSGSNISPIPNISLTINF